MPQMAPLSWLSLFLYFTLVFIIIGALNFYLFNKLPLANTNKNKLNESLTWKW